MASPWSYVALAIALCTPWPIFALGYRHLPNPDRVAVPSNGETLDSAVSPVFGRGKYFQVVDLGTGKIEVIANPYRTEKHAVGLRTAYLLADHDVGVVIARNIGPEPFNNLVAKGAAVFTTEGATVMQALTRLRRGELVRATAPNVKIHYGLEQQGQRVPPQADCPLASPQAPGGTGQ